MRTFIYLLRLLLALATLPTAIALMLWLGVVPARMSPLASIDLSRNDQWFIDLRLAAMKTDTEACKGALRDPYIAARAIADAPLQDGCGWINSVAVDSIGAAKIGADKLSCPMAGALAMWMAHEVQPAARDLLSSKIVGVRHMGTYACRNIMGVKRLKAFRSQHATANAIDISAFILDDGRIVSVLKNWTQPTAEAAFLHRIHQGACRFFRVAVGPEFNAAHRNHFHLDRGAFKSCR